MSNKSDLFDTKNLPLINVPAKIVSYQVGGNNTYAFTIPINGAVCVDGRIVDNLVEKGMPGIYGGDFGGILAILEVLHNAGIKLNERTTQQIADNILNEYRTHDIHFYAHSDEHAKHEHEPPYNIGCGHTKTNFVAAKTQDAKQLAQAIYTAYTYVAKKLASNFDILHGDHKEQAVLVVKNTDLQSARTSLRNITTEQQTINVFVNNPNLAEQIIKWQAFITYKYLQENKPQTVQQFANVEEFMDTVYKTYLKQAKRTDKALVEPKGLEVYEVEK